MKSFLTILAVFAYFCSANASTLDFTHYWTLEEIASYLLYIDQNYHEVAHIERYGTTSEGRFLEGLHIATHHHHHSEPKSVIFIEAGLRPREWISVMSTLYFIHEIVEHSDEFDDILDELEFVVIPVANPDGYAYTHMTDRQWNKNRRFNSGNPTCPGVDLNANFNHAFQTRPGDECSSSFPGTAAFSEIESQRLSELMVNGKYLGRISMYISLQAFGELIVTPFSNDNIGGGDQVAMTNVANRIRNAIHGRNSARNYQVGIAGGLRPAEFGTVTDFALSQLRIPYVFTIFLPAGGVTGFDPPTTQIAPIASETFYGLLEPALYLMGQ